MEKSNKNIGSRMTRTGALSGPIRVRRRLKESEALEKTVLPS
jgi:hypothetical protein